MQIVGLTGGKRHGKSTTGHWVRYHYSENYSEKAGDLEFSDVFIDLTNAWLPTGINFPSGELADDEVCGLADELIHRLPPAVEQVLGRQTSFDQIGIRWGEPGSMRLHEKLLQYLREVRAPFPLNRENKDAHTWLLQWQGTVLKDLVDPSIFKDEIDRRIDVLEAAGLDILTLGGIRTPVEAESVTKRGGLIVKVVDPRKEHDSDHTEQGVAQISPDALIVNNGTKAWLQRTVVKLVRDIKAETVRERYVCSEF